MTTVITLLGAIVAGIVVQAIFTYRQTVAFSAAVRGLRRYGVVSVGGGGQRYRGGKAFVALAADPDGRVTKAISLSGWTTLARPTELHHVRGLRLSQLCRDNAIASVGPRERSALQNAAQTLRLHQVKAA